MFTPRRLHPCAIAFVALAASCHRNAGSPSRPPRPLPQSAPSAAPPPLAPGAGGNGPSAPGQGCQDISTSGPCTFDSVRALDATADAGTLLFQLSYLDQTGRGLRIGTIRASAAEGPALERYYREHSPAHCEGHIITAPCPPTERIALSVPPPPVGAFEPAP